MKKIIFTVLALSGLTHIAYADSEHSLQLDASISYDDNLNRSPIDEETIDSAFAALNAGYNFNYRINRFSFIDYHLSAKYEDYQDTPGLTNAQISSGLSYKFKPSAGFTSATYTLKIDIGAADFETDIRDRTEYDAAAIMSFWVTNTVSMRTGISGRVHDSDSRVFDTTNYRLFFNTDFLLSRNATLYTTLNLITGDLVSTVPLNSPGYYLLDIIRQADEIEFDPTFGDNMIAYRLDTNIGALSLGYNHVTGKKQSLDISARYAIGKADYNVEYASLFFNISYLISFGL
jgi:hypothetical protein